MKCSALGVFALVQQYSFIEGITAVAAADPGMRRRMCAKAERMSRKAVRAAESWMK